MRSYGPTRCAQHAAQYRQLRHYLPTTPISQSTRRSFAQEANVSTKEHQNEQTIIAQPRFNEIGVQHISDKIHTQLFKQKSQPPPQEYVELAKKHLSHHDLLGKQQEKSEAIAFDLPPLYGSSLDEHFHRIAQDASEPYYTLARKFAFANPPPRPRKWIAQSGWTKYHADGTSERVEFPDESMLAFDVEVMWKETQYACMACAASPTSWYGWISPHLLGESETDAHLIPLGDPTQPRLIVGHNIGYDRARVKEEYSIQQTKNYFMDTMSLHVAVNGMCTRQRPTWMKHSKARDFRDKIANSVEGADLHQLLQSSSSSEDGDEEEHLWIGRSSVNSLRDVAKFHCGITIDKARREYFGELNKEGILARYDELMDYCAADVDITHRVYRKVFPAFLETCPHPVSFAALRHLSSEILPVNQKWEEYISSAESTYHRLLEDVQNRLIALTNKALELKDSPEAYKSDPWLSQLDWSGQEIKYTKAKKKGEAPRPVKRQKLPGMPKWYKELFTGVNTTDQENATPSVTVRSRIAPLLLKLTWLGHPLIWSDVHGWTFRIPESQANEYTAKSLTLADMSSESNPTLRDDTMHAYIKLPHKDGPTARCANPLAKGYLSHFEKGTLHSEYPYAKEALEMNASCSYWISARERIRSQMVVYESQLTPPQFSSESKNNTPKDRSLGFILPRLVPMGTITRRAVENTWLTASNAKANRVGSELKSMITAPRNVPSPTTQKPTSYVFVGADVDSEELWICSLLGDSQLQQHGSTALGFMTLEGSKALSTEFHSRTASILGTSRNDAKIFNYGRIYGAGLSFAQTLLKQFNPSLSEAQVRQITETLYSSTKGIRTSRKSLHPSSFYRAGTESLVFNTLAFLADASHPRTPVLGAAITEALQSRYITRGEFLTSRINWTIQSSGVDYLHCLIVAMEHLCRVYSIEARVALTVHDEIRYLVREEDKYRAAMALQISNLWTRAFFAEQVGIKDLPQSCAFFSGVDIDTVLRKEVTMDCVTPSHQSPIPAGECLDIHQLLAKGDDARLILPTTSPSQTRPQSQSQEPKTNPPYQPRTPVITSLMTTAQQQGHDHLRFLRAQLASSDEELRGLIREARTPSPTTSASVATSEGQALTEAMRAPSASAAAGRAKKKKGTGTTTSKTHSSRSSNKKRALAPTTGNSNSHPNHTSHHHHQQHPDAGSPCLMLPEMPWLEAQKLEQKSRWERHGSGVNGWSGGGRNGGGRRVGA